MESSLPLSEDLELRLSRAEDSSLRISAFRDGTCVATDLVIPPEGDRAEMSPFVAVRRVLGSICTAHPDRGKQTLLLPNGDTLEVFENAVALSDSDRTELKVWRASDLNDAPGITTFDILFSLDSVLGGGWPR